MRNSILVFAASVAVVALVGPGERRAAACGGCFHEPVPPTQVATDITDERMLLSVSPTQTTLYDQIRYTGSPGSFAWVLPIHGTVDVGLSADVLFDSIDTLTATKIQPPPRNCPPPPFCGSSSGSSSGGAFGGAADAAAGAPSVVVTKQENVGPYATVQLHATDSSALGNWLVQNGFEIPAAVQPVLDQYVAEGFDFLAMKLLPNQGVQAMRPVRVTTQGASTSLPLRMAAIGTGATVGITIWVVSDGRYEPQNFPAYHIDDADLVWDWAANLSNYTTLRAAHESASNNTAWEIESSLDLNEALVQNVILQGGRYYVNGGFGSPGGLPAVDATEDYLPVGSPDAGGYLSADAVRDADLVALFTGLTGPNARFTRMRSDIAHAAMTKDFVVQASADQTELSNVRLLTQSVNLVCTVYPPCPGGSSGSASADASVPPGSASGSSGGSRSGSSGAQSTSSGGAGSSSGGGLSSSGMPGAPFGSSGSASSSSSSQSHGCAAAAPSEGSQLAQLAAIAGVLGVAFARLGRARRRRTP